jgi:hypothetical protein
MERFMSQQTPSLHDDLTYLRDLAEGGQNAPLLGGRFYVWWGGLAALAYVGHFAIAEGLVAGGEAMLGRMWLGFVVVGMAGFLALMATFKKARPGAASAGNRVSNTIWMPAGIAMFVFFAGVIARSYIDGEPNAGFFWSVPMWLTIYGIAQVTTGAMAKSSALMFGGWVSIVCVGLAVFFSNSDLIWLVGAVAAFFGVWVPGILLMLREPRETV